MLHVEMIYRPTHQPNSTAVQEGQQKGSKISLQIENLLPIIPLEAVDKAVTNRTMIDGSSNPAGRGIGSKILTNYVKISAHIVIKPAPVGAD